MENKSRLGLYIPEQTPMRQGSFLDDPERVGEWINSLPIANVGETARRVFKALVELNRMELSPATRIKVTELFHRPINHISEGLRKYYYDVTFPLAAKSHKVAVLNRELHAELAIAYKIFIEEILESGSTRKLDRKLLVIAIHRTLRQLARVLYHSVIVYEPYPKGVWREIHRLYRYAEKSGAEELPVKETPGGSSVSSIQDIYLRSLLFAACSPYRLRQPEIAALHQRLPEWSGHLILGKVDQRSRAATLFISKLDSDRPPGHISIQERPFDRHCRQLDTSGLVSHLRTIAADLAESERGDSSFGPAPFSARLLHKLMAVLSSRPERRYVRTRLNFELNTAAGIPAIHAMTRQSGPEPSVEEPETGEQELDDLEWFTRSGERPLINTPLYGQGPGGSEPTIGSLDDPMDEAALGGANESLSLQDSDAPVWTLTAERKIPDPFNCKTDNESAGGYCILWHGPGTPPIKVGEVLGIQSTSDRYRFAIGIIRWMRNVPIHGLQVGVEFIARESAPVLAGRVAGNGEEGALKCLLLPGNPAQEISQTLITPPLPFHSEDRIWIDDGHNRREVELTRLIDSSGAFSRFQFVTLDQGADTTSFDDIWSEL